MTITNAGRVLSRQSLSARIVVGLGLGVFVGLFFGEPAAVPAAPRRRLRPPDADDGAAVPRDVAGRRLRPARSPQGPEAGPAGRSAAAPDLGADPRRHRGDARRVPRRPERVFFSHSLVEPRQPFSFADLYFTANPFQSLSNAVVPAVVLFSSMVGIALMGIGDRERLLGPLRVLNAAITSITLFVVRLTPVGVFAIGAVTAGTMTGETLQRLQVYFVVFAAASLLLAFWVLPLLVTAMTPFRYREVTGIARDALLTAFVANNAFIVLPILVERSKDLLRRRGLLSPESDSAAEVLVPILFNFPNAGKLLTLLFVPFAAWLAGSPFSAGGYAALFAAGLPSYFAKAQVALPFLMDLFGLPHDLFQLYIPTTILSGKFDSMVTAMNLLVFALLGAAAMGGFLVLERGRLVRAGLAIAAGIARHRGRCGAAPPRDRRHELPPGRGAAADARAPGGVGRGRPPGPLDACPGSRRRRGARRSSAFVRGAPCAWATTRGTRPSASGTRKASSSASTWSWPRAWPRRSG